MRAKWILKNQLDSQVWWCTPILPALWEAEGRGSRVRSQPGLLGEFMASRTSQQDYISTKSKKTIGTSFGRISENTSYAGIHFGCQRRNTIKALI